MALLACVASFYPVEGFAQPGQLNPSGHAGVLPDIIPSVATNPAPEGGKDKRVPARLLSDRLPEKPTLAPSFSIPVEPLGFTPPGPFYMWQRYSMASLDFFGEDKLLFTFRVPGLIRRDVGQKSGEDERQIRAVVVNVKTGQAEAEALWTVHDYARYIWMLKDGHFLLRDRDSLQLGDRSLVLKPLLQFPGPLEWLEMDPQQLYMVTNSHEPVKVDPKPGQVDSPSTAEVTMEPDVKSPSAPPDTKASLPNDFVVRILERSTGKVMLVSRARSPVHLPINAEGYLERLRANGSNWLLNMSFFSGGSRTLGRVDSSCSPNFDFITHSEFLVTACASWSATRLIAVTTDGRHLWEDDATNAEIWPLIVTSPDGFRFAREAIQVARPVSAYNPIDTSDVKGQSVRILNAADGSVALEAVASPALDAGGNVAISPNGQRVAILSDGAIQVFDLPPAPALPESPSAPPAK
jgi:hypothetical protein